MRKKLLALSFVFFSLSIIFSISTVTSPISSNTLEVQAYFTKVADVPFKPTDGFVQPDQFFKNNYGDCNDRALTFATYLHEKGATDVHICCVYEYKNGHYITQSGNTLGHCFVVWNNQVYDPCYDKNQRYYAVNVTEYKKHLKRDSNYNLWCVDSQNEHTGTFFN